MSFLTKVRRKVEAGSGFNLENYKGKIHVTGIQSEIIEDSWEHGMLDSTGAGLDEKVSRTFSSVKDMIKWLHSSYNLSNTIDDYEIDDYDNNNNTIVTSRGLLADHTHAQNGGWMDATEEEEMMWKKGEMKLYTEEVRISFLIKSHL